MLKFDAIDEFKTRLNGTHLRYRGGVFYSEISGGSFPTPDPDSWFFFMSDTQEKKDAIKVMNGDPDVTTGFKLGMYNGLDQAFYLVRLPVRKFKCGISNDNIRVIQPTTGSKLLSLSSVIKTPGFMDMVNEKYPTYEESEKACRDGDMSCQAFSRQFAVTWDGLRKDYVLIHKTQIVGFGRNRRFTLADDFKHLRETLEEQKIYA